MLRHRRSGWTRVCTDRRKVREPEGGSGTSPEITPWLGGQRLHAHPPQLLIADSEVMGHLVDHGVPDLREDLLV